MPAYLLDSSLIIDLINGRRDRRNFIKNLLRAGDSAGCCTIKVIEIYSGMRAGERQITREYIDSLFYYDGTRAIAESAGALRFRLRMRRSRALLSLITVPAYR